MISFWELGVFIWDLSDLTATVTFQSLLLPGGSGQRYEGRRSHSCERTPVDMLLGEEYPPVPAMPLPFAHLALGRTETQDTLPPVHRIRARYDLDPPLIKPTGRAITE